MIKFGQSMRKKASREVNLTPMIDIIFNLLIFFLITAVISQKGLNIKLPNAETAEVPKIDTKKIVSEFNKKVNEEIAKNKVYPRFAQQHGLEGVVKISFSVDSEGVFQDIKVALSSGEAILDKAALESVEKSSGKIKKSSEIKKNFG